MSTIKEAQDRSERVFKGLLADQAPQAGGTAPTFSWFDVEQALEATLHSFRFAAISASRTRRATALNRVLDDVDHLRAETDADAEMLRQALAMFVTHNTEGRVLVKPRTITAAPGLFAPIPVTPGRGVATMTTGGAAPELDYWREDPMANEHHGHWHEVYPLMGRPPEDFAEWIQTTADTQLVAVLESLAPGQQWAQFIATASVQEIAGVFAQVFAPDLVNQIVRAFMQGTFPAELYWTLFSMNDRHGELFVYMHKQMLARYDAELLSNALARVEPFGPLLWDQPIPESQTPTGLGADFAGAFGSRAEGQSLSPSSVAGLQSLQQAVDDALTSKQIPLRGGVVAAISRDAFGEFVEGNLHNVGHGRIAQISTGPGGVMRATIAAIRDQVFWRWHKHIDDLAEQWYATLTPEDFADAPPVLVRNDLPPDPAAPPSDGPAPWSSPDIILVNSADLPDDRSPAQLAILGRGLFGGSTWDQDFTEADAESGQVQLTTISEIVTAMQNSVMTDGRAVTTLTHEPYSYFLRVENPTSADRDVTIRIFLVPASEAADRRAWIEMDKFIANIPANTRQVLYRPDTESSVIKRPAELGPADIAESTAPGRERSYCDCGWPYPLLVPRGTELGMEYRLLVLASDAALDRVSAPGHCGSMSFCGALDRYPDSREMGFPFARPFAGDPATAVSDAILEWTSAAARTVTVRHV